MRGAAFRTEPMTPFFRREALDGQRQGWLGSVQVVRPVALSVLAAFVAVAALLVCAYLCLGQYTRKARVGGVLVPDRGLIRLMAPQAATVLEVAAREGATVRAGEVLFVLSVDRATPDGDTQAAVQSSLAVRERSLRGSARQQAALSTAQGAALDRRLADMGAELAQIDAEARLHEQRIALGREAEARLEALRAQNFVSAAQVQAKSEELLGLRAAAQALARQRAAQQREIGALEAQRRELPLQAEAQQAEIERGLAGLAQATAESRGQQRIVVRAPQPGVLTAVLAAAGQNVTPAAALAGLMPAGAVLQAHLYAPSSAVGFVRAGQPVWLRYQAYPFQKFGHQAGRVLQVSRTPLQAVELAALSLATPATGAGAAGTTLGTGEPLYRITVALDRQAVAAYGRDQPLAAGMQLDADVLLDRRRLVEWLFEPLLGLAGRV